MEGHDLNIILVGANRKMRRFADILKRVTAYTMTQVFSQAIMPP